MSNDKIKPNSEDAVSKDVSNVVPIERSERDLDPVNGCFIANHENADEVLSEKDAARRHPAFLSLVREQVTPTQITPPSPET